MPRSSIFSCKGRGSILLTFTLFAIIYNWTPRRNIMAYVISSYEEDAISMFRVLVQDLVTKDYMKSDGYLLRWLRYTDFDVEKAYKAFEDSTNWRNENNIDSILKEGYSNIEESYPYSFNGFDREGRPVIFLPLGTYDLRKVALSGEQYKYERTVIRALELGETYFQEIRDQTGFDNITQIVAVMDLAGFNLKQTGCLNCLKILPAYFALFETHYPLIFYKIFIINAPAISHSAIQIAKHFMSQATKENLQVFGYDKDKWSKALLELISPENLPMKYGGIKPNFDKDSYATRNAAVIHLLGNAQHMSEAAMININSTANYNGVSSHMDRTVINSNHPYQKEIKKISAITHENRRSSNEPVYEPTSWFDSVGTSFDWNVHQNIFKENSTNVLSLTNTVIDEGKVQERHPDNQNHKQKHHHHQRKITRSDKSEQFTNSAETSVIYDHDSADAAKSNSNNLFAGNYVLLLSLMFVNFLIFIY